MACQCHPAKNPNKTALTKRDKFKKSKLNIGKMQNKFPDNDIF